MGDKCVIGLIFKDKPFFLLFLIPNSIFLPARRLVLRSPLRADEVGSPKGVGGIPFLTFPLFFVMIGRCK